MKLRTRPDHNFVDSGSGQQIARLSSIAAHDAGKVLASKRHSVRALALLVATVQLPAAFALDNEPATFSLELVPFSSDEGLVRLARSTAKVDFPALPISSKPSRTERSVGPRLPQLCSTPFEVGALICRGTVADYIQKTLNTFRALSIPQSLASRRTT